MSHVQTSYSTGDDALANQAILGILPLANFFSFADPLTLRVTVIDIPESVGGTYINEYKTGKVEKPSGKIETPTEFTISFRADKYMAVYQAIQAWHQAIYNNTSGAIMEDASILGVSNFRTDLTVKQVDSNDVTTYLGWTFLKAFPKSVGAINFDQANGDPIVIPVTFSFLQMIPTVTV